MDERDFCLLHRRRDNCHLAWISHRPTCQEQPLTAPPTRLQIPAQTGQSPVPPPTTRKNGPSPHLLRHRTASQDRKVLDGASRCPVSHLEATENPLHPRASRLRRPTVGDMSSFPSLAVTPKRSRESYRGKYPDSAPSPRLSTAPDSPSACGLGRRLWLDLFQQLRPALQSKRRGPEPSAV